MRPFHIDPQGDLDHRAFNDRNILVASGGLSPLKSSALGPFFVRLSKSKGIPGKFGCFCCCCNFSPPGALLSFRLLYAHCCGLYSYCLKAQGSCFRRQIMKESATRALHNGLKYHVPHAILDFLLNAANIIRTDIVMLTYLSIYD